jgi:hypothetical protein
LILWFTRRHVAPPGQPLGTPLSQLVSPPLGPHSSGSFPSPAATNAEFFACRSPLASGFRWEIDMLTAIAAPTTPWFPLLLCFGSDSARAYKSLATVSSLPRRERERKQLAAAARHCRGVPPRRTPHRATRACFGVRGVSPDATEASHRIASREGPLDLGNFSTATATPPPIRCSPRTDLQRTPSPVSTCPPCSRNLPFALHQFNWGLGRLIAGRAAPARTRSQSERRRGRP